MEMLNKIFAIHKQKFLNSFNHSDNEWGDVRISTFTDLVMAKCRILKKNETSFDIANFSSYRNALYSISGLSMLALNNLYTVSNNISDGSPSLDIVGLVINDLNENIISDFENIKETRIQSVYDMISLSLINANKLDVDALNDNIIELKRLFSNIYKYSILGDYILSQKEENRKSIAGKIIVIEGIDGSGKKTQAEKLHEYFLSLNIKCKRVHFPSYGETFFGKEVGKYLDGCFGKNVNPKLASILFAGDRFEKRDMLKHEIEEGSVIILDRYVYSNVAHHVHMLPQSEQPDFESWLEQLEFEVFKLPRPDLIVFLDVNPNYAKILISKKEERNYTTKKADLYEENLSHLIGSHNYYKDLVKRKNWIDVNCNDRDFIKSEDDIAKLIVESLKEQFTLPEPS